MIYRDKEKVSRRRKLDARWGSFTALRGDNALVGLPGESKHLKPHCCGYWSSRRLRSDRHHQDALIVSVAYGTQGLHCGWQSVG